MKVLYVRSSNNGIDPITTNQGESLRALGLDIAYFDIEGKGLFGYLKNIPALRKKIHDFAPDLLHAHYALCGFVASLAFTKLPVGVSLMGCDVNDKRSVVPFFTKVFAKYFWRFTIVKSSEMFRNLGNPNAAILPNGIDFNQFKELDRNRTLDELNWDHKSYHILFASDPSRYEKNYPLAKQAIHELKKKVDTIKVHYLMRIEHEKMPLYYNAADLLLLTSIREGSPNVIKEALACNCPVVSTKVGDVAELISGLENCMVSYPQADDLANAMYSILISGKRVNARKNIFHLDRRFIAKKMVKIYDKAL